MDKINQWKDIAPPVAARILEFFNRAQSAKDISESPLLKDDPSNGSGNGTVIGLTVAQRIIDHKNTLPGRRFRNILQLEEINGIGADKINDLNYSFGQPADKAFVEKLKSSGTLMDNWEINAYSDTFDEAMFEFFKKNPSAVRSWAEQKVWSVARELYPNEYARNQMAIKQLRLAYDDHYEDSHMGAIAFAFWFYHFDQDNWFTLERMREITEYYLGYYPGGENSLELHLYKGFQNSGVIIGGSPDDLPVVVNFAERRITIWAFQLND